MLGYVVMARTSICGLAAVTCEIVTFFITVRPTSSASSLILWVKAPVVMDVIKFDLAFSPSIRAFVCSSSVHPSIELQLVSFTYSNETSIGFSSAP